MVEALSRDPDKEVRRGAAYSLRKFAGSRVLDSLVEAVKRDPDEGVRAEAAESLGVLGGTHAIAALRGALFDPSESVVRSTVRALGKMSTAERHAALERAEALDLLLSHARRYSRKLVMEDVIDALHRQNSDFAKVVPMMIAAMQHAESWVNRAQAARALGDMKYNVEPHRSMIIPALIGKLSDEGGVFSGPVRGGAIWIDNSGTEHRGHVWVGPFGVPVDAEKSLEKLTGRRYRTSAEWAEWWNQERLSDPMAGCYAVEKGKRPEIRISKESGEYYAALRKADGWDKSKEPLRRATDQELKALFDAEAVHIADSLVVKNGPFGVFRAKPAAKIIGKDPSSDYLAFLFLGGGVVFKVNCD